MAAEDVERIAQSVVEVGGSYEFIIGTWGQLHFGDKHVGKCLIASIPVSDIKKSKGVHVSIIGPSGTGKSDCLDKAFEVMPKGSYYDGDMTPQALYYDEDGIIAPGTIIGIDDIVWGDALGASVKKITSRFQKVAGKISVKEGKTVSEETAERLTFWVTQVDLQADEQIRDRFLMPEVDSSPKHIEEVKDYMKLLDEGKEINLDDIHEQVLICREIVSIIRQNAPFDVVIPFSRRIQDNGGLRGYSMFKDMIKAFAVFRFMIRERDGKGRIIATEEDFNDAKEILEGIGGISRDKFGSNERAILKAIIDNGNSATYKVISLSTGIDEQYVRDLIKGKGKDAQQRNGLISKCKGKLSIDYSGKAHKLRLDPSFNLQAGLMKVSLKPEETEIKILSKEKSAAAA